MANNITLSRSIRENLLALQSTADLLSSTQKRLATGRKVNSALDNPSNFFTSQGLNSRANDLNSLLDSIGQAQKTLDAADKGITSLTSLVESAKSIVKQARQAASPTSVSYGAILVSGTSQDEIAGTTGNGSAITVTNSDTYSFTINFGDGSGAHTVRYIADAATDISEILAGLQSGAGGTSFNDALAAAGLTASDAELVANGAGTGIKINAKQADIDITIAAALGNDTSVGIAANSYNSTSLLDRIVTAGGSDGGSTLQVAVNGANPQIITFGTGVGEVSTLDELDTKLGSLTGLSSAGVNGSAFGASRVISFNVASASTQNSIALTGSTGVGTALGSAFNLTAGVAATTEGVASVTGANATRTALQSDYNNVLDQISTLAADASYNGVNLLNGDDLSVIFNETGTSTLDITGVTYDAAGLSLSDATGTDFQVDSTLEDFLESLDSALSSLRTQASRFGANLTTVQTRQDFTKNLISTLQQGADALVLADTNEEAANLLALQTRQQLSQTSLSLANQSEQSILRLF